MSYYLYFIDLKYVYIWVSYINVNKYFVTNDYSIEL